ALVKAGDRTLVSLELAIQLGRDEQLLAIYAAIPDAFAHATLVAIAVGGVDVTVAGFDCAHDHRRDLVVVERSGAQADLGDGAAVVETEGWYGHAITPSFYCRHREAGTGRAPAAGGRPTRRPGCAGRPRPPGAHQRSVASVSLPSSGSAGVARGDGL